MKERRGQTLSQGFGMPANEACRRNSDMASRGGMTFADFPVDAFANFCQTHVTWWAISNVCEHLMALPDTTRQLSRCLLHWYVPRLCMAKGRLLMRQPYHEPSMYSKCTSRLFLSSASTHAKKECIVDTRGFQVMVMEVYWILTPLASFPTPRATRW
jgi:hypothetical protein